MAGESRDTTTALTERVREDPYAYHFLQAVRRFECANPALPRVGTSARPVQDPLRFGQYPTLAFPPSTLQGVASGPGGVARLLVSFMGLLGPNGPMPLHITEYVHDRLVNAHDGTFAAFLDVFHHRMVSFFYRAWAMNQKTVSYDRPDEDRFAAFIASFIGTGMPSYRRRDALADSAKLYYSGHLVVHNRHAEGLRSILATYFGMVAEITPFVGEWIRLPEDCYCRLGASRDTGLLGQSVVVGRRIYQCQHRFRVHLGPMGLEDYERMLPRGDSFARLCDWVRNYVGDELAWDAQLILKAEEVPPTRLGVSSRLGWNTWMCSGPVAEDRGDLVLRPQAADAA